MHLDEDFTGRLDTLARRVGVARGELIRIAVDRFFVEMAELRRTFSAGDLTAPEPDPDAYTDNLYLPDCEDANRAGLVTAGIGAAVLAASAIIWWRQRSAPSGSGGQ